MHIYGPAHLHGPQSIGSPHASRPSRPVSRPDTSPINDELEISDVARLTEQAREVPEIRQDKVDSIRAEIAKGTYDTDAKLDVAIERLLDEIG